MKTIYQTLIMCLVLGLAVLLGQESGLSQEQAGPGKAHASAQAAKGYLEVRVTRDAVPVAARLVLMHVGEVPAEPRLNVAGMGTRGARHRTLDLTGRPLIKIDIGLTRPHRLNLAPGIYGLALEDPMAGAPSSGVLHLVTIKPGKTVRWSGEL